MAAGGNMEADELVPEETQRQSHGVKHASWKSLLHTASRQIYMSALNGPEERRSAQVTLPDLDSQRRGEAEVEAEPFPLELALHSMQRSLWSADD